MSHDFLNKCKCGWCPKCTNTVCPVCTCKDGELTTTCAGTVLDEGVKASILDGELDYRFGSWVNVPAYITILNLDEGYRKELQYLKKLLRSSIINIDAVKFSKRRISRYNQEISSLRQRQ